MSEPQVIDVWRVKDCIKIIYNPLKIRIENYLIDDDDLYLFTLTGYYTVKLHDEYIQLDKAPFTRMVTLDTFVSVYEIYKNVHDACLYLFLKAANRIISFYRLNLDDNILQPLILNTYLSSITFISSNVLYAIRDMEIVLIDLHVRPARVTPFDLFPDRNLFVVSNLCEWNNPGFDSSRQHWVICTSRAVFTATYDGSSMAFENVFLLAGQIAGYSSEMRDGYGKDAVFSGIYEAVVRGNILYVRDRSLRTVDLLTGQVETISTMTDERVFQLCKSSGKVIAIVDNTKTRILVVDCTKMVYAYRRNASMAPLTSRAIAMEWDVTIQILVGTCVFNVHKHVLTSTSEYFRAYFSFPTITPRAGVVLMERYAHIFNHVVKFMYSHCWKDVPDDDIRRTYELAMELIITDVQPLESRIVTLGSTSASSFVNDLLWAHANCFGSLIHKIIEAIVSNLNLLTQDDALRSLCQLSRDAPNVAVRIMQRLSETSRITSTVNASSILPWKINMAQDAN